jgi:hypothetical protein
MWEWCGRHEGVILILQASFSSLIVRYVNSTLGWRFWWSLSLFIIYSFLNIGMCSHSDVQTISLRLKSVPSMIRARERLSVRAPFTCMHSGRSEPRHDVRLSEGSTKQYLPTIIRDVISKTVHRFRSSQTIKTQDAFQYRSHP